MYRNKGNYTEENYTYIGSFRELDPAYVARFSIVSKPKEITYTYFKNNCIGFMEVAKSLGYTFGNKKYGLRIHEDQMIRYFKSTHAGKKCMYFVLRGVRYVWIQE